MLTSTLTIEHVWSTRPPYLLGAEHVCTQGRKEVFFLNTLKISIAQSPQEGPFQVMFVETQQTREQTELNTRKRKGQDTTKITSGPQSHASNVFNQ